MVKSEKFSPKESAIISAAVEKSGAIVENELKKVNWLMAGIIVVMFTGFLAMLVVVIQITIDSSRFNSATYKEYSSRVETNNVLLKSNRQNQEIIIKNQEMIIKRLDNKK